MDEYVIAQQVSMALFLNWLNSSSVTFRKGSFAFVCKCVSYFRTTYSSYLVVLYMNNK